MSFSIQTSVNLLLPTLVDLHLPLCQMGVDDRYHVTYALPPGKDLIPIVHMAGCALGPVWTGVFWRRENFVAPFYSIASICWSSWGQKYPAHQGDILRVLDCAVAILFGVCMCGCFDNCVGILVIYVLVFPVFCIVCTVFLYFSFMYIYFYLLLA